MKVTESTNHTKSLHFNKHSPRAICVYRVPITQCWLHSSLTSLHPHFYHSPSLYRNQPINYCVSFSEHKLLKPSLGIGSFWPSVLLLLVFHFSTLHITFTTPSSCRSVELQDSMHILCGSPRFFLVYQLDPWLLGGWPHKCLINTRLNNEVAMLWLCCSVSCDFRSQGSKAGKETCVCQTCVDWPGSVEASRACE